MLKDTYPTGCHLIVCRNVVIYFTEEAKDEIYRKFYAAMAKDWNVVYRKYRADYEL